MTGETYRFEDYELDTALYQLRRTGEPVHVEPRALDLLSFLIENRSRVVSKIEILDVVWGDRFVTEAALTTGLRTARRAIGDSGDQQRLIRTVHGRGYQFMGQVTVIASSETVRLDHAGPVGSTPVKSGVERQAIRSVALPTAPESHMRPSGRARLCSRLRTG